MATLPKWKPLSSCVRRAGKRKASSGGKSKRKTNADPVAVAALNALSSSDSDDDAPLIKKRTKTKEPRSSSPRYKSTPPPSSSSDDDDDNHAPRRKSWNAKPGSAAKKASPKGKRDGARTAEEDAWMESSEDEPSPTGKASSRDPAPPPRDDLERRRLKPVFAAGAAVTAAWWPDPLSESERSWHPGVVRARRRTGGGGSYGPTREYDVAYDDGDALDGVADHLLFAREDYELTMQHKGRGGWVGVRNVVDHDTDDLWAQIVGWYVATIDGEERPFSLLADALDAYDASVVARRTWEELKSSDLNRPEKYSWLFERNSAPAGGGSEAEGRTGRKRARKRTASSKNGPPEPKKVRLPAEETPSANPRAAATKGNPRPANPQYKTFSDRIAELQTYREKHGHFPSSRSGNDSSGLAAFAQQCRQARANPTTAPVSLSERQIGMLDGIGFWSTESNTIANSTDPAIHGSTAAAATSEESSKPDHSHNTHRTKISAASAYIGVSYSKKYRKYVAQKETEDATLHCLGYYTSEVDAALAIDKGAVLGAEEECNFAARHQYENDVRAEKAAAGGLVDVKKRYAAVVEKVGLYLSRIYANGEVADAEYGNNSHAGVETDNDVGNTAAGDDSGGAVEMRAPSGTGQRTKNMPSVTEIVSKRAISTTTEALHMESKSQRKQSQFTGVSCRKQSRLYAAHIMHHRKQHFLGYYKLQTDGAMAYDQAAKLLREANRGKVNFKKRQDYLCARAKELEKNELGSESLAEITKKIQTHLLRIPPPCPELVLMNDAMSKKWACYLPPETGEEFLELYQKNIHGLLLSEEPQRTKLDTSAPSVTSKDIESVQGKNPDAFFKPIMEETCPSARAPQLPCHSQSEDSSDDDDSLSSNSNKHDDADSLDNNSAAGSRATDVSGTGSLGLNNHNIERQFFKDFPMPIGCPTLWNFNCNSFTRGVVISPPIHGTDGDTAYKVMPVKSSKVEPSTVIPAKELAFGLDCPVHVSSPSGSASHPLEGKILFCTPVPASANNLEGSSFLYTILIIKEGNQFQVMNDVPSPRVRYRTEKEVLVPKRGDADRTAAIRRSQTTLSMANSNGTSTDRGRLATSPAAIGDINSQTSSHKFFSLNSTITSVD